MMLKALIVDDEQALREILAELLADFCPDVQVVGKAANTLEAEKLITEHQPDLVFLDIEMPEQSGIRFLQEQKEINYRVIFVTAFDKYALQAIKLSAVDYLLKPIDIKELIKAVNKVKTGLDQGRLQHFVQNTQKTESKTLALPHSEGVEFIPLQSIVYCQAEGSYTRIFRTGGNAILASRNLKNIEEMLGGEHFLRCHKSYLINLTFVERMDKDNFLHLSPGYQIPLSTKSRSELIEIIQKRG